MRRHLSLILVLIVSCGAILAVPARASAQIIDFTSPIVQQNGPVGGGEFFEEDGYRIERIVWGGSGVIFGLPFVFENGATDFSEHDDGVMIERIGGGLFDLDSFDVRFGGLSYCGAPGVMTISGDLNPGSLFALDGSWETFQIDMPERELEYTISPSGFRNVQRVWLLSTSSGTNSVFLDNITLSSVPEPAGIVGIAFFAAALLCRRKR